MHLHKIVGRTVSGLLAFSLLSAPILVANTTVAAAGPGCPIGSTSIYAYYGISGDMTAVQSTALTLNAAGSFSCSGSPLTSFSWDFGDGTTGEGAVVSHTYGVGIFEPTLTIRDGLGNVAVSPFTQRITVKESNTPPAVENIALAMPNTSSFALDLRSVVSDSDQDKLHITIPLLGYPINSSYISDRQYRIYTIDSSTLRNTTLTIPYTVDDLFGGVGTGYATVQLLNTPPTATSISALVDEDTSVTVNTSPYTNDVDNDNFSLSVTQPEHGTAFVSGSSIVYRPNLNYNGTDSLTYSVSDGRASVSSTLDFTVVAQNDSPTWQTTTWEMNEDTPLTVSPLDQASDIDGDQLNIIGVRVGTENASATVNADNTVTISPAPNTSGSFYLYSTISDGTTTIQKVDTVNVAPVNDAPVIGSVSAEKLDRAGKKYVFSAQTSDVDTNETLTFSWDFGDGTKANGSSSIRHDYTRKGTYTVTVTVTDSTGATATKSISITV